MRSTLADQITTGVVNALRHLLHWRRSTKRFVTLMADSILCIIAVWIAFSLRLGEWILWDRGIFISCAVALLSWYIIAPLMGIYREIVRFGGSGMLFSLTKACSTLSVVMICVFMINMVPGVPRTISIIQPIVFLMLLVMSRVSARYLLSDVLAQHSYDGQYRDVLIYGAGQQGQQLAASVRHEPSMRLVGFVDDDIRLRRQTLDGVKVYHANDIATVIKDNGITDVLLALPHISRSQRNQLIEQLKSYPVHVMTLPLMSQVVDGEVSYNDLQELKIEDLLGRDPVPPNQLLMGLTIRDKTVLVTGAGGSIGSELCRQIVDFKPRRLVLVELSEYALYEINKELRVALGADAQQIEIVAILGNVADPVMCAALFDEYRPETVFHAAAYKHVPLVEANPVQGIENNVFSTWNAALNARRTGVSNFILISTDKAVRPTNIMGASKRICELILQALAAEQSGVTKFAMVRFGNVLGSSGSVVPHFEKQIREGGPVTLTHKDITRYFMTIPEAAQLVIQAGAMAHGGEVYVLDMGESVKIYDLATTMIRLSGLTVLDENHPDGDIAIEEIGLRPGEKLYEELLIGDNPQPTRHSRIMQASEKFIPIELLQPELARLKDEIAQRNRENVLQILMEMVPEYQGREARQALRAAIS